MIAVKGWITGALSKTASRTGATAAHIPTQRAASQASGEVLDIPRAGKPNSAVATGFSASAARFGKSVRNWANRALDSISAPDTKIYSGGVTAPRTYGQIKAGAAAMGRQTY